MLAVILDGTMESSRTGWNEMVLGLELLVESKLIAPALTLTYSMIDAMAWLSRPADHPDVTGPDFIAWVDRYMLPARGVECTASELYAARCAILHSLSTESRRVRNGQDRALYYAFGDADCAALQIAIDFKGKAAVAVHLDLLVSALKSASRRLWEDADSDPEMCDVIRPRLDQWLTTLSA